MEQPPKVARNGESRFPTGQRVDTRGFISPFISDHLRFRMLMASGVLWSCLLGNEPSTVKALLDLILRCPEPI